MPKAVLVRAFGEPETFALEEFDPGQPGPGEVRVAIKVAGVSFVDVLATTGKYQHVPTLPYIPGSEGAGIVECVGEGVSDFAPGDRVLFSSSGGGLFATANVFPASRVSKVPEGVSLETAAVIIANYNTALYALIDRARARPGETMLVVGAAGGTGIAAIQVGKHLGLRVIASASSEEKRQAALAAGADVAVETGAADWRDQVRAANGGRPVDIVFDPVGGELSQLALRTLDYDGRHLVIGFTAGIPAIPTNLALLKSVSIVGVHLGDTMKRWPEKAGELREKVLKLAAQGVIAPTIAERYPLRDFVAAMNSARAGKAAGRIVIEMD
ncbi:MAG: NADPH:quinone oxidoreductase family protein [Novosphingobium sp.]|nr:NADPH:quinone oxidoreductase family protein [Novosphingobium sp.]